MHEQRRWRFLNAIRTAIPANEVHGYSRPMRRVCFGVIATDACSSAWSSAAASAVFRPGTQPARRRRALCRGRFADTGARMRVYQARAADLAFAATVDLDDDLRDITHLLLVSCTGFAAPGVDLALIERLALSPAVERTCDQFHGVPRRAQRAPPRRHIVRSSRRRGCS